MNNQREKQYNTYLKNHCGVSGYDEYVKENLGFYLSVKFPFTDPFDNRKMKGVQSFIKKSKTRFSFLDEYKKCGYCNRMFINNKLCNKNNIHCEKKSCRGLYYNYPEYLTDNIQITFELYRLKKKIKSSISIAEIENLELKYNISEISKIIRGYGTVFEGHLIFRKYKSQMYSLEHLKKYNVYRMCNICEKSYVYKSAHLDNNHIIHYRRIGAKYTCKDRRCYYKIMHKYEYTEETRKKQSRTIKKKIANGEFTPCVTNSRSNSRVLLNNIPFRSTWEAYFYVFMTKNNYELQYEKLRIQYFDPAKNTNRNYITDFIDENNKIVYEIKPNGLKADITVQAKEQAAAEWCKLNNYKYIFISEDWFKENYTEDFLKLYDDNQYVLKMKRNLKQFLEK